MVRVISYASNYAAAPTGESEKTIAENGHKSDLSSAETSCVRVCEFSCEHFIRCFAWRFVAEAEIKLGSLSTHACRERV